MPRSKALTWDPVRKERYVQNLTLGMDPRAAAAAAGFPNPAEAVRRLKRDETTLAMLASYQAEMVERYRFDRDKAVRMLIDAYDVARQQGDPKGMVAAVRELNEVHGHHAPKQLDVDARIVTSTSNGRRALAELTDEELMAEGGIVIEGEAELLEHET